LKTTLQIMNEHWFNLTIRALSLRKNAKIRHSILREPSESWSIKGSYGAETENTEAETRGPKIFGFANFSKKVTHISEIQFRRISFIFANFFTFPPPRTRLNLSRFAARIFKNELAGQSTSWDTRFETCTPRDRDEIFKTETHKSGPRDTSRDPVSRLYHWWKASSLCCHTFNIWFLCSTASSLCLSFSSISSRWWRAQLFSFANLSTNVRKWTVKVSEVHILQLPLSQPIPAVNLHFYFFVSVRYLSKGILFSAKNQTLTLT